jgi:uncharacterized protein YgiM (DUF1202 family)
MKKIIFLAFLCVAISAAAQQSGTLYVAAKTGLSIREKPETGAKVLDKIPYGTKITLLETDHEKKSIITEGMTGYWQKVKYNNKTGYIIDSYLLPWTPPKLATVKEMKNYLTQVTVPFGAKLVVRSGTMNNISEGGWQLNKQLYKNGAEWHQHLGYEYGSDVYYLPGFSLQQGFLLLRLIPEFNNVFGEKDEFPTESKSIKRGEDDFTIKVDKEMMGDTPWYNRIKIEYADGAYYMFEMHLIDNQLVVFYGAGV